MTTKKTETKKPEAKKAKTSAPKAKTAKKTAKAEKPEAKSTFRREEAAQRSTQEAGSIAPPSKNLVSAFSLFKTRQRPTASIPAVTRLTAGSPLSRPAAAKPAAPETKAPAPAAQAPQTPEAKQAQASPKASAAAPAASPPQPAKTPAPQVPPARTQSTVPVGQARPAQPPVPAKTKESHATPTRTKPAQAPAATHRPQQGAKPAESAPSSSSAPAALKPLSVSSTITVRELAEKMEIKPNDLIKKLMGLGVFATINQRLDNDSAAIVAQDYGFELKVSAMYKEEELAIEATKKENPADLKPRSPVVTIMGHVDHGKTTLLDAIRSARVAEGESGGITQHIGAYRVATQRGDIVFLDTPGHQAFTAMRARGAKVTDIVVLVVSAADGVMPQTIEAIDHAKAAGVPIIVAVNKIDLPGANPQKIRQELSQHGVMSEEWGGKAIFVEVSAKKKVNLDGLLDMIALQAEVLELKANPDRPAFGVILEAKLDPKKGSVATLLVQGGTVKIGDPFIAGLSYGKIKALIDDTGRRVESAGPAVPVEILGITGSPQAGDMFSVVSSDKQSRDIAEKRATLQREQAMAHQKHMTLVGLKSQGGAVKELNIVLKADVQGSLQALKDSLEGLSTVECKVRIIHSGVGNANESDILLASASDAVVLLFHTDSDSRAQELAARDEVEIRRYEIIYDLIGEVKAALEGLLEPEIVDVVVGQAEVLQVFAVRTGKAAGCVVREGKAVRGATVRVVRNGKAVGEGRISGLKRFKDDVKEVEKGLECGLTIDNFSDFQNGDKLEFISKETRTRKLSAPV